MSRWPWHEAGHAVVAWLTGCTIVSASIGDTEGHVLCEYPEGDVYGRWLTLAAGLAADLTLGRDRDEAEADAAGDLAQLTAGGWGPDRRGALVIFAGRLLEAHRAEWSRVAELFMTNGEYTGDQVRAALRPAPAVQDGPQNMLA